MVFTALMASTVMSATLAVRAPAHELIGFGVVVNVLGNGRDTLFARQVACDTLVRSFGLPHELAEPLGTALTKAGFVSVVLVVTDAPAGSPPGGRFDAVVSPIDDSRSVRGGFLLATPIKGADGVTSATAGGFMPLFSRTPDRLSKATVLTRQLPGHGDFVSPPRGRKVPLPRAAGSL